MTHTISVLVENKPGALMRITSMFARRGFNIESLAVGPTERHDVSRMTIRVNCEQQTLEQIEKQMHKLVNVLRVQELVPGDAVERELLLVKVAAPPDRRAELIALGDVMNAQGSRPRAGDARLRGRGLDRGARVVRGARPAARHQGARPHRSDRSASRIGEARRAPQAGGASVRIR